MKIVSCWERVAERRLEVQKESSDTNFREFYELFLVIKNVSPGRIQNTHLSYNFKMYLYFFSTDFYNHYSFIILNSTVYFESVLGCPFRDHADIGSSKVQDFERPRQRFCILIYSIYLLYVRSEILLCDGYNLLWQLVFILLPFQTAVLLYRLHV